MRTTTCNKCGIDTTARNPQCDGWRSNIIATGMGYIDLCPNCGKEYDKVRNAAWNTYEATIRSWLGCVTDEPS